LSCPNAESIQPAALARAESQIQNVTSGLKAIRDCDATLAKVERGQAWAELACCGSARQLWN